MHVPSPALRLLPCLLLLLLSPPARLSAAPAGSAAPVSLTVMVEDDAAPWSLGDGTGFANEVVTAAFAAAGVQVGLEVVPYARCKNAVMQGRCAACFSMSWLPEFAGAVSFSARPLFTCSADYFTGDKRPVKARTARGLPKGTVVGTVLGYEYPPSVYALRDQGVLVLEESRSEERLLKKLAAGRLDLALLNTNAVKSPQALLLKAGVAGQVHKAFAAGLLKSYLGFSLGQAQGAWAKERFDRGYRAIASDGRLKAIEAKWRRVGP